MADYLLMVLEDEDAHASLSPKDVAELIDRRQQFVRRLRESGRLKDAGQFRPSKEGRRVWRDARGVQVDPGPFAEGGKALGAYYVIDANGDEGAAGVGVACPALPADVVDVRPVMKGQVDAQKLGKPGKIFSFVVLGNRATEDEWRDVMDRIDAETAGCFPPDAFHGGVRLMPPTAGRRVATRGERRATFDGPFLECKEVIGGVFFMRMATLDDAVTWASGSRFVVHGTLEIRELWRS